MTPFGSLITNFVFGLSFAEQVNRNESDPWQVRVRSSRTYLYVARNEPLALASRVSEPLASEGTVVGYGQERRPVDS